MNCSIQHHRATTSTRLPSVFVLVAAAVSLGAGVSSHADFAYSSQDLLLNIRPTDAGMGDPNLTVNLGSISVYRDAQAPILLNSRIDGSLEDIFGDLDNLGFSASAAETSNGGSAPRSSVWNTRARDNLYEVSVPWTRFSRLNSSQGGTAAKISSVGSGARGNGSDISDTSTLTADGALWSYHSFIVDGDFRGSFQGNIENYTGTGFSSAEFLRSDLFELLPGVGAATRLGFVEFQGNGDVWFVPDNLSAIPESSRTGLVAGAGVASLLACAQWRRIRAN